MGRVLSHRQEGFYVWKATGLGHHSPTTDTCDWHLPDTWPSLCDLLGVTELTFPRGSGVGVTSHPLIQWPKAEIFVSLGLRQCFTVQSIVLCNWFSSSTPAPMSPLYSSVPLPQSC